MGADACLSKLLSKIDPSELAAKEVLRASCLRRELSRRWDFQKLVLVEVLSALLQEGEVHIGNQ